MDTVAILMFLHFTIVLANLEQISVIERQVVLCAKDIAKAYFDENDPIVINILQGSNENTRKEILHNLQMSKLLPINDIIVKELTYGLNWPGIIVHYESLESDYSRKTMNRSDQIIIIISDFGGDIYQLFEQLANSFAIWHSMRYIGYRTRIIIGAPEFSRSMKKEFIKFTGSILTFSNVYSVLIILHNRIYDKSLSQLKIVSDLYTWYPTWEYTDCGEFKKFSLVGHWDYYRKERLQCLTHLFPMKIPKVFNGCPIIFVNIFREVLRKDEVEWAILNFVFNLANITIKEYSVDTLHDSDDSALSNDSPDMVFVRTGSNIINQLSNTVESG